MEVRKEFILKVANELVGETQTIRNEDWYEKEYKTAVDEKKKVRMNCL